MFTSKSITRAAVLLTAVATSLLLTGPAVGQDTLLINYQGYLTDGTAEPVTGELLITFTVYDGGGVSKWAEVHPAVQVNNGLFTVVLGSHTALPGSVFDGSERYLGIAVEGAEELSPRTLLTSSPGAVVSRRVVGDIMTAPGSLEIYSTDDPCVPPDPCTPALEMLAAPDIHVIRVHPPDPCVPPEPCTPALELIADAEVHSFKIHPPEPCDPAGPCLPAIEMTADATSGFGININDEAGKVMGTEPSPFNEGYSLGLFDPESDEPMVMLSSNHSTDVSSLTFSIPSDRDLLQVSAAPSTGAGWVMFNPQPEPPGGIAVEITTTTAARSANPGGNIAVNNIAGVTTSLSGGVVEVGVPETATAARGAFQSNGGVTTLTLASDGAAAPPSQIALVAGVDGASLSIGTATATEALTVMGNGWFSGDVYTYTDTKVKTNIRPIDDALNKVSALSGYYYDFRTDEYPQYKMPTAPQVGLLAREVSEVLPEVVRTDKQGIAGVSYSRLTAVLIEAVKELKAENDDLKARIEALERR